MTQLQYFDAWPSLLSAEVAARYLSLDEADFRALASGSGLAPVDLGLPIYRWRRSDLDRWIKQLPQRVYKNEDKSGRAMTLDDQAIELIAKRLAPKVSASPPTTAKSMLTILEAAKILSLGRTTIYRLINEGKLNVRKVGRRTLIRAADVDALID